MTPQDTTTADMGADALRSAAQAALDALEQLDGLDTETEVVTIHVCDEIEALRAALASTAQQAAPVAQGDVEDAARYQALAGYLVGPRTDIDDAIVHCRTVGELSNVIDTIRIKEGGNHE